MGRTRARIRANPLYRLAKVAVKEPEIRSI